MKSSLEPCNTNYHNNYGTDTLGQSENLSKGECRDEEESSCPPFHVVPIATHQASLTFMARYFSAKEETDAY